MALFKDELQLDGRLQLIPDTKQDRGLLEVIIWETVKIIAKVN